MGLHSYDSPILWLGPIPMIWEGLNLLIQTILLEKYFMRNDIMLLFLLF